jgi:ribosomal protein S24E
VNSAGLPNTGPAGERRGLRSTLHHKGVSKMRLREWDCGYYDAQSEFGRITVRERSDGRFDVVHVRYVRTAQGPLKSESVVGVYSDLTRAKDAGWALSRALGAYIYYGPRLSESGLYMYISRGICNKFIYAEDP